MAEAGVATVPFEGNFLPLIAGAKAASVEAGGLLKEGVSGIGGGMLGPVLGAFAGLGAAVGFVTDAFAGFQSAEATLVGNANISAAAASAIGDAFTSTAGQVTFSATQMLEAFSPVSGQLGLMQGHALDANQSLEFMKAAMDAAEASGQPLNTTTAALSQVMVTFGIGVDGAAASANTLYNIARLTNTPMDSLATAVDKLHQKLGVAAPSLADTGSLLVDLNQSGITGTKGMAVLSTALTTLLGGSHSTNAELAALGINVFDSQGKFVGMGQVIQELVPKLSGMTDQQRLAAENTLFGKGAAESMNAVLTDGIDKWSKASAAVNAQGTAQAAAAANSGTLEGVFKKVTAAIQDYVVVGVQALGHAADWVVQHWNQIAPIVLNVLTVFVPLVAIIRLVVSNFQWLSDVVGGALLTAFNAVAGAVQWVIGVVQDVQGALLEAHSIVQGLAVAFETIGEAIGIFATGSAAGVSTMTEVFSAIGDKVKIAVNVVLTAGAVIKNIFVTTFEVIRSIVEGFVTAALYIWRVFHDSIMAVVTTVWNVVKDVFTTVFNAIRDIFFFFADLFMGHWGKLWDDVKNFLGDVFGGLVKIIGDALGGVLKVIEALPGEILTALGDLTSLLAQKAADLIGGLLTGIKNHWADVVLWLLDLPVKILVFFVDAAIWLLQKGADLIGGLLAGLVQKLPDILLFFVELPIKVLGLLITIDTWLVQKGLDLLKGLLGGIGTAAGAVWTWFTSLPGKILGLIGNALGWLLGIGGDIVQGLFNGILIVAEHIWNWFTSIPGLVASFFTGAITWLLQIGKDIITGLLNGVKAAWDGVTTFFHDIPGHIADFFKGALGIHSPSTVMHEIGLNIIQGLHNGLKSQIPAVLGTLTQLSADMSNAVTGQGTFAVAGAGGGITGSLGATLGAPLPPGGISTTRNAPIHLEQNINVSGTTEELLQKVQDAIGANNAELLSMLEQAS